MVLHQLSDLLELGSGVAWVGVGCEERARMQGNAGAAPAMARRARRPHTVCSAPAGDAEKERVVLRPRRLGGNRGTVVSSKYSSKFDKFS